MLGKSPDLNQEPSEPQSDTLPIELHLPLNPVDSGSYNFIPGLRRYINICFACVFYKRVL